METIKTKVLIKTAMANKGINNGTELARLSGVPYSTVIRALNDGNIGANVVIEMLDHMGYQLSISLKGSGE